MQNTTLWIALAAVGGLAAGYGAAYLVAQSRNAPGAVSLTSPRYYAAGSGALLPGQVTPVTNPLAPIAPGTVGALPATSPFANLGATFS